MALAMSGSVIFSIASFVILGRFFGTNADLFETLDFAGDIPGGLPGIFDELPGPPPSFGNIGQMPDLGDIPGGLPGVFDGFHGGVPSFENIGQMPDVGSLPEGIFDGVSSATSFAKAGEITGGAQPLMKELLDGGIMDGAKSVSTVSEAIDVDNLKAAFEGGVFEDAKGVTNIVGAYSAECGADGVSRMGVIANSVDGVTKVVGDDTVAKILPEALDKVIEQVNDGVAEKDIIETAKKTVGNALDDVNLKRTATRLTLRLLLKAIALLLRLRVI